MNGERLRCNSCKRMIEGSDVMDIIVLIGEKPNSESLQVRCQTCHAMPFQTSEKTQEAEDSLWEGSESNPKNRPTKPKEAKGLNQNHTPLQTSDETEEPK